MRKMMLTASDVYGTSYLPCTFAGRMRPCEMAGFHVFVKEQKAITFPEEALDPDGGSATEKEQDVRHKQMHMKSVFNNVFMIH